jgi:hypothetical protein
MSCAVLDGVEPRMQGSFLASTVGMNADSRIANGRAKSALWCLIVQPVVFVVLIRQAKGGPFADYGQEQGLGRHGAASAGTSRALKSQSVW